MDVTCVAFSMDGTLIATRSEDKSIRVWDMRNGATMIKSLEGHSCNIVCVAFSPDGLRLSSGSGDGTLRLWDVPTGMPLYVLEGHTADVLSVVFSACGGFLASSSSDETICLWSAHTGKALCDMLEVYNGRSSELNFSENASQLVSRSLDNYHCIWSVPSGDLLWMSSRSSEYSVNVLSDTDAREIIKNSGLQTGSNTSEISPALYLDEESSAIMMKCDKDDDKRLASLPDVAGAWSGAPWKYFPDRGEFVAVLLNGFPACFRLYS